MIASAAIRAVSAAALAALFVNDYRRYGGGDGKDQHRDYRNIPTVHFTPLSDYDGDKVRYGSAYPRDGALP